MSRKTQDLETIHGLSNLDLSPKEAQHSNSVPFNETGLTFDRPANTEDDPDEIRDYQTQNGESHSASYMNMLPPSKQARYEVTGTEVELERISQK